jgi:hypothetical protein
MIGSSIALAVGDSDKVNRWYLEVTCSLSVSNVSKGVCSSFNPVLTLSWMFSSAHFQAVDALTVTCPSSSQQDNLDMTVAHINAYLGALWRRSPGIASFVHSTFPTTVRN